jgi:hypothetical protein
MTDSLWYKPFLGIIFFSRQIILYLMWSDREGFIRCWKKSTLEFRNEQFMSESFENHKGFSFGNVVNLQQG